MDNSIELAQQVRQLARVGVPIERDEGWTNRLRGRYKGTDFEAKLTESTNFPGEDTLRADIAVVDGYSRIHHSTIDFEPAEVGSDASREILMAILSDE